MPWQEVSRMQLRREFVSLVEGGSAIRPLCRRFGISPTTAYKWLKRHRNGEALTDHSRQPVHSPRRSEAMVEAAVLALRDAHPKWGARKLRRWLIDHDQSMPAVSTVHAILIRHGYIEPAASAAAKPWQRFEHAAPNDLWQMDFKGHFAMGDGRRCHPLTVLDDHSRYNLCLAGCVSENGESVRAHLIATFRRYGLPRRMSMDNGPPWGDTGMVYTAMDLWLMKQGIGIGHSRPYHPQTQGKDERFHRTLKAELLQGRVFDNLEAAQRALDRWREVYNHERPHDALALDTPGRHYRPSAREYCEQPADPEYSDASRVRRVQDGGWIYWRQHRYRVGTAFAGEPVDVRLTGEEPYLDVYWTTHRIARIDVAHHTSIHGRKLP